MKLIVTIPAYNEEKTIGKVIKSIPRKIKGIKSVKALVINDGSTDKTSQVAKKSGADYIISQRTNLGLARAFQTGISEALRLGADIVVNTDADNQYSQKEIPKLIKPILEGKADMVIGNRQIEKLKHIPLVKKYGNIIGSWTLRLLTGSDVIDASSGFRAFSREAALRFNILSNHTYVHETIIQAVENKMRIAQVPITFRRRRGGKSRLITGLWGHIKKSLATIMRTILMYKPFKTFLLMGSTVFLLGIIIGIRFLYFF